VNLLWPGFLLLLVLIPLLIAAYIWILRRRRRFTVRYSSLSLVRAALPRSNWRRHLPFALFMIALTSLILALVRPVAIVSVPTNQTTIILAMDVSRSMCSTDIPPNRLAAAEQAASSFVQQQGGRMRIGIVAFAGFAQVVQSPTNDDEVLLDVINSLTTGRRTAIGSAILESIDALAEIDPSIPKSVDPDNPPPSVPPAVPKGAYAPAIIVLLTDGSSNAGPDPVEAAKEAADRGLRIYTIGFGTANPGGRPLTCAVGSEPGDNGQFDPGFGFGGGFGAPGGFRRAIDEGTLNAIANATGGKYFPAESAQQLNDVFAQLPTNLIVSHEVVEASVAFSAIGTVLLALAILLGQRWRPLP